MTWIVLVERLLDLLVVNVLLSPNHYFVITVLGMIITGRILISRAVNMRNLTRLGSITSALSVE